MEPRDAEAPFVRILHTLQRDISGIIDFNLENNEAAFEDLMTSSNSSADQMIKKGPLNALRLSAAQLRKELTKFYTGFAGSTTDNLTEEYVRPLTGDCLSKFVSFSYVFNASIHYLNLYKCAMPIEESKGSEEKSGDTTTEEKDHQIPEPKFSAAIISSSLNQDLKNFLTKLKIQFGKVIDGLIVFANRDENAKQLGVVLEALDGVSKLSLSNVSSFTRKIRKAATNIRDAQKELKAEIESKEAKKADDELEEDEDDDDNGSFGGFSDDMPVFDDSESFNEEGAKALVDIIDALFQVLAKFIAGFQKVDFSANLDSVGDRDEWVSTIRGRVATLETTCNHALKLASVFDELISSMLIGEEDDSNAGVHVKETFYQFSESLAHCEDKNLIKGYHEMAPFIDQIRDLIERFEAAI